MDASTEQKIRLLAIAILELDRDATERLLQHLPESLSQRILGQSRVLQDVSAQERAEAIETIASLLETAAETTDQVPRVSLTNPHDRTVPSWVESVQAEPLDALVSVLKFERPTVIDDPQELTEPNRSSHRWAFGASTSPGSLGLDPATDRYAC